jgi:hypothetical protein
MAWLLCKTIWQVLKMLNIGLPYDPVILLIGIHLIYAFDYFIQIHFCMEIISSIYIVKLYFKRCKPVKRASARNIYQFYYNLAATVWYNLKTF